MQHLPIVSITALLAAGCAAPRGAPLEPTSELRSLSDRTSAPVAPESRPPATPEGWFPASDEVRFEDGLVLEEANALAFAYAPAIVAARREAGVRDALLLQAGRLGNPTLFAGPRLSTSDAVWIVPLSLSQPLPLGGRLTAEEDHARADVEAARARVTGAELDTLAEVRRDYVRGAALEREVLVLEGLVADAERVASWVGARLDAGEADAVSAFNARAGLEDARWQVRTRRARLGEIERRLRTRVGLLADAPVRISFDAGALDVPDVPAPDPEARLSLPRLRAREADYRAAEAALREELAARWPGASLGPEFEAVDGDPSVGLGLSLELPVFDRNEGRVLAARERLLGAREEYRRELLDASRAEADARAAMEAAADRLAALEPLAAAAAAARTDLSARLRRGEVDVLQTVVTAESLTRFELRRIAARTDVALARIDALLAGGRLTSNAGAARSAPEGTSP